MVILVFRNHPSIHRPGTHQEQSDNNQPDHLTIILESEHSNFHVEKTSIDKNMINDIINFNKVDYFVNFSNYDDLMQDNAVFNRLYII